MAGTINLKRETTLSDVAGWLRDGAAEMTFIVWPNSDFTTAVEGVALTVLRELWASGRVIHVDCRFGVEAAVRVQDLGLFDGLFGLCLAVVAKTIRSASSDQVRPALLQRLWDRVRQGRGCIGHGKRLAIVSRDPDVPVPAILRTGSTHFPQRAHFAPVLQGVAHDMGFGNFGLRKRTILTADEEAALTFLYETARNSHEHGRHDRDDRAVHGIRGTIIERLIFTSRGEVDARSTLPEWQRQYAARVWPRMERSKRIVAYTVVDLGSGIQNTLPPVVPEESPWDRLNRAFRDGETRKPKGTDVEAGVGLYKVAQAAMNLKALLVVKSGELLGFADFSVDRHAGSPFLEPWPEGLDVGHQCTSVTLMWPDCSGEGV
jgi:hypothetical protein